MNKIHNKYNVDVVDILCLILAILVFQFLDISNLFVGQIIFFISLLSNIQLLIKYRKIDIFFIFLAFTFIHTFYIFVYYFLIYHTIIF